MRLIAASRSTFAHHGQALISSLGLLWRKRWMTFATLTVIAIALGFPAGLQVLTHNAERLERPLGITPSLTIFLKPGISDQMATQIAQRIHQTYSLPITRVIDRRQALQEFKKWAGVHGMLHFLGRHPLPAVLVFSLPPAQQATLSVWSTKLSRWAGISAIRTDVAWLRRLAAFVNFLGRLSEVLYLLFALATCLIVGNTIRLDIENAHTEIVTLKLLGAPGSFIRRPFLYRGGWYGLLGGIYGFLILIGIFSFLAAPLSLLGRLYDATFVLQWPSFRLFFTLLLGGGLLGWLGAAFAIGHELKRDDSRF
ncbi:MAG: permease-like cell division protein FtsX [Gammaproteobacteria bacterium]